MEKRLEWVDLARGIGIILMVMGHVGFGKCFDYVIHAFHMPLFFLISGYFFKPVKDGELIYRIRKRARSLLVPYVSFAAGYYFLWIIIGGGINNSKEMLARLCHIVLFNTDCIPISNAIWFLTSSFFVECVAIILFKYIKNDIVVFIAAILISAFGVNFRKIFKGEMTVITSTLPIRLPWGIDISFAAIGFFVVGYCLRKYRWLDKFRKCNVIVPTVVFFVLCVLSVNTPYVNMRSAEYGNFFLFYSVAIILSVCLLLISDKLYACLGKTLVIQEICHIGKDSIVYLCCNQGCIFFLGYVTYKIIENEMLASWLLFIGVMVELLFLNCLFQRTVLRVFIGKRSGMPERQ